MTNKAGGHDERRGDSDGGSPRSRSWFGHLAEVESLKVNGILIRRFAEAERDESSSLNIFI